MTTRTEIMESLRARGRVRVRIPSDPDEHEVGLYLLRHDPNDPGSEEFVITLDSLDILLEAVTATGANQ